MVTNNKQAIWQKYQPFFPFQSLSPYTFIRLFLSWFAFSSKKLDSTIFPWLWLTDLPAGIVGHVAQGGSWGQPIITDGFDQRFKHSLSLSHVLSLSLPISHCLCLDLCPHSREGQESERWMQSSRGDQERQRVWQLWKFTGCANFYMYPTMLWAKLAFLLFLASPKIWKQYYYDFF